MNTARIAVTAVAALALLTACGGSSGSPAPADSALTASGSPSETATPTESSSSPESPSSTPGLASSLVALQLCGTTLGYAAGAIAGVPADQLSTLEQGVASAQSKAGTAEAALLEQSKAVVAAVSSGDQAAITDAGQKMGELCGAD